MIEFSIFIGTVPRMLSSVAWSGSVIFGTDSGKLTMVVNAHLASGFLILSIGFGFSVLLGLA